MGWVNAGYHNHCFERPYWGPSWYPSYCWYPRWSTWVSWSWGYNCLPVWDPRPIYCRPIVYEPCVRWVYYDYPVWQPLPVRTGSIDVVLCVFAPRNPAEFARVLAPRGRLIVVTPTADHLAEPRERYGLLGIETDKRERLLATMTEFLTHERTVSLRRTAPLPSEVVDDLIAMGPNAFHDAPQPGTALQVTLALDLHVFRPLLTEG